MRISDWSSDVCSSDLLGIGDRVDLAFDVGDVAILEAAQYMTDRIDLADMGEELVAEALTLRGTAHQAGDIDEGQLGRDDLARAGDLGQHVQSLFRHADQAGSRPAGADRKGGGYGKSGSVRVGSG